MPNPPELPPRKPHHPSSSDFVVVRRNEARFPFAPQSDILRCHQKDEFYLKYLDSSLRDAGLVLFGNRQMTRFQSECSFLTNAIYFFLFTLRGRQTLGEECGDLLMVDNNHLLKPAFGRRIFFFIISILVPFFSRKLFLRFHGLSRSQRTSNLNTRNNTLTRFHRLLTLINNNKNLRHLILKLAVIKEPLYKFHLALFYLYGVYYSPGERVCGIRRIIMRNNTQDRTGYQILGILATIQQLFSFFFEVKSYIYPEKWQFNQDKEVPCQDQEDSTINCSLCLSSAITPTTTKCGHIYCWKCICEACVIKEECPLCRQPILIKELLALYYI